MRPGCRGLTLDGRKSSGREWPDSPGLTITLLWVEAAWSSGTIVMDGALSQRRSRGYMLSSDSSEPGKLAACSPFHLDWDCEFSWAPPSACSDLR